LFRRLNRSIRPRPVDELRILAQGELNAALRRAQIDEFRRKIVAISKRPNSRAGVKNKKTA